MDVSEPLAKRPRRHDRHDTVSLPPELWRDEIGPRCTADARACLALTCREQWELHCMTADKWRDALVESFWAFRGAVFGFLFTWLECGCNEHKDGDKIAVATPNFLKAMPTTVANWAAALHIVWPYLLGIDEDMDFWCCHLVAALNDHRPLDIAPEEAIWRHVVRHRNTRSAMELMCEHPDLRTDLALYEALCAHNTLFTHFFAGSLQSKRAWVNVFEDLLHPNTPEQARKTFRLLPPLWKRCAEGKSGGDDEEGKANDRRIIHLIQHGSVEDAKWYRDFWEDDDFALAGGVRERAVRWFIDMPGLSAERLSIGADILKTLWPLGTSVSDADEEKWPLFMVLNVWVKTCVLAFFDELTCGHYDPEEVHMTAMQSPYMTDDHWRVLHDEYPAIYSHYWAQEAKERAFSKWSKISLAAWVRTVPLERLTRVALDRGIPHLPDWDHLGLERPGDQFTIWKEARATPRAFSLLERHLGPVILFKRAGLE